MWGGPNQLVPRRGLLLSFGKQREGAGPQRTAHPHPGQHGAQLRGQRAGWRRGFTDALWVRSPHLPI